MTYRDLPHYKDIRVKTHLIAGFLIQIPTCSKLAQTNTLLSQICLLLRHDAREGFSYSTYIYMLCCKEQTSVVSIILILGTIEEYILLNSADVVKSIQMGL